MTTLPSHARISPHWSRPHLVEQLREVLASTGLDLHTTTPDTLAPLDQFHGGGKEATRTLAQQAEITAGTRVLDVGGGLGGPARMLAVEREARVTVVDLTFDYLRAGQLLTSGMGLAGQVVVCHGDALALPFADASFDLVWTQNSGMNIADKARLYQGFFRVLRPGGRLAQVEPIAGPVQPTHFPLMWARTTAESHLLEAETLYQVIVAAGFRACHWNPAVRFTESAPTPDPTLPQIQRLIMGEELAAIQAARERNQAEDRLRTMLAVFERPA
jgi:SAM-dependent methyltransferase